MCVLVWPESDKLVAKTTKQTSNQIKKNIKFICFDLSEMIDEVVCVCVSVAKS